MREDTARHANEVHGFDTDLKRHGLQLAEADRITAWVMAAVNCLHQYHDWLANEWRERVYTSSLQELTQQEPEAGQYAQLYRSWEKQRPYGRGADVEANETYAGYRRRKFDLFLAEATRNLPEALRRRWQEKVQQAEMEDLPAYQQQLSILAYLEPGLNDEVRTAIPLKKAHIGLIHQGRYYLIPACAPQSDQPADLNSVRAQVATLFNYPANTRPVPLARFSRIKRTAWAELRKKMNPGFVKELDMLRMAPILLNCDRRPRRLPLAELRQAERGIGDHPLTLFDTGESMIVDQAQIFFDGAWGAALAEIMTNEALSWAVYLAALPPLQPRQTRPYALNFRLQPADLELMQKSPQIMPEVAAETEGVNLKAILRLRRLFKRRNDLIALSVNDLLLLYRAIHAATYEPSAELEARLNALAQAGPTRPAALAALEAITASKQAKPAIVIPVDGSRRAPRDRLYPITFETPVQELGLLDLHRQCMATLDGYQTGSGDRSTYYADFDKVQRSYLTALAGFGIVLSRTKEIAGENAGLGGVKLLAQMPAALQRMLEAMPSRGEVLNDLLEGREIFANVGAVASGSSLSRFMAAKDDHEKKTLIWGVITDAAGVMRISLRDFRPHVGQLIAADQKEVAVQIVEDYLNAYVTGLNRYILDLQRITETSRETRLARLEHVDG
jgi:hypothetical protein